jgi:hypothetical protein
MTTYNDYIASKRLYTVNNGFSSDGCNSICMSTPGPLYDGDYARGMTMYIPGPTGPSGDVYISYFTKIFYAKSLFNNCIIGIKIDDSLAYLPGMYVKVQTVIDPEDDELKYFYGTVHSYDRASGVLVIHTVEHISDNFPYGINKEYVVNIDNTGPPVELQSTLNQTIVDNTMPTKPIIGLVDDVIIGSSLTFSQAEGTKISYGNIGTEMGFIINDNIQVDKLFFTNSGDKYITHSGTSFAINDAISLVGNTTIGNINEEGSGTVITRLPQNATTDNSFAVRMSTIPIGNVNHGIQKWQLFASTSTAKQKTNIETLPDSTSILDVRPVSYNPISTITGKQSKTHIGFIAEEMAQNELGNYFVIRDEDGSPKSIQYELLIPLYASAMRSLRSRVGDLENMIAEQGKKIEELLSHL